MRRHKKKRETNKQWNGCVNTVIKIVSTDEKQTDTEANKQANKHQNRDIKRTNIVVVQKRMIPENRQIGYTMYSQSVYLICKTALEIHVCIFRRFRNGYPMSHVPRSEHEDPLPCCSWEYPFSVFPGCCWCQFVILFLLCEYISWNSEHGASDKITSTAKIWRPYI